MNYWDQNHLKAEQNNFPHILYLATESGINKELKAQPDNLLIIHFTFIYQIEKQRFSFTLLYFFNIIYLIYSSIYK